MDMFNGATAWLSHQQQPTQSQHIHDPQHVHHDGRQPSADTWKERAGAAGIVQQGMDLSDFDISGELPFPDKRFAPRASSVLLSMQEDS